MKRNESAVELRRGSGPDPDTLMFFDGHREALQLYLAFEDLLCRTFPAVILRRAAVDRCMKNE